MKILHLTLKKKWFDMILSGEKKEEYREIKPYWFRRLVYTSGRLDLDLWCRRFQKESPWTVLEDLLGTGSSFHLDVPGQIVFRNGYASDAPEMTVACAGLGIGQGNSAWGAPDRPVFIFKLGDIIETK